MRKFNHFFVHIVTVTVKSHENLNYVAENNTEEIPEIGKAQK